jgi:hypothetical protein
MGMATKKPKGKAPAPKPGKLQNLAAKPTAFSAPGSSDALLEEEQLVDTSGVFRVTSAITQAQIGHDEEASARFASDSLVMAAQRDGFRERGPSLDDAVEEHAPEDEAAAADRRARIATLAARNAARTPKR